MDFSLRKLRYSVSLIGALALLFSGCSEPEVEQAQALVDSTTIAPGEECEFGGERYEIGLDLDGDGVLSEDEITSAEVICFESEDDPETPETVSRVTEVEPGAECEAGGWLLEYGVDISGDGELRDEEIDDTEILCREVGLVCDDRDELEFELELESNDLNAYFIGESYGLTIEFNQEIAAQDFSFRNLEESVGNIEMNEEPDGVFWRGTWTPHQDYPGGQQLHLAMTDGCSLAALVEFLPEAREQTPTVNIWADADHLEASGDSTEVCWASAFVDECNLSNYDESFAFNEELDVELEGCREFTVENELTITIECFDSTEDDLVHQSSVTVLAGPRIDRFSDTATGFFPPSSAMLSEPGEVELFWETTFVESCELDNEIESVDVPTEQMEAGYVLMVDETATLTLTCEGLSGESLSRDFTVIVEVPPYETPATCEDSPQPDRCTEDPEDLEFGPASLITEMALADTQCCFDLTNDGSIDNNWSMIIGNFGDLSEYNDFLADHLDDIYFTRVLEIDGLEAEEATTDLRLNAFFSIDTDPQSNVYIDEPESFEAGTHPNYYFPQASVMDSGGQLLLEASSGTMVIPIAFMGFSELVPVEIENAHLEAELIGSSAVVEDGVILSNGRLGGVVSPLALVQIFNDNAAACDCLGNPVSPFEMDPDTREITCEPVGDLSSCDTDCEVIGTFCESPVFFQIFSDIDTTGNGESDSFSIGMTFEGEATVILGLD